MEKWLSMIPGRRIADAAELKGVGGFPAFSTMTQNEEFSAHINTFLLRPMCFSRVTRVVT